jgi:putative membrane protein
MKTLPLMSNQQVSENNMLSHELAHKDWSRVAPIGIAYFFVKALTVFVTRFLLYLIPAFALNMEKIQAHSSYIALGLSVLVMLFATGALLHYLFYTFRISGERVEIKKGVLKKSSLDLPFNKIQNVKIEEPFYYRPFGFASIELESAGSMGQEANIVAMKLEAAHTFKQRILDVRTQQDNTSSTQESDTSALQSNDSEVVINTRSVVDLVIHGITNNRVWLLLGAAAPFYQGIVENLGDILLYLGMDIEAYLDYNTQSLGVFILHALSVVMFIMLLIVSLSVLGSILVFYDYRLSRQQDRYVKRSGLISKQEVTMKKSRIQVAVQQQDWLDILIGRANLKLEQNVTGINNANSANDLAAANKLIVPSITPPQTDEIIDEVFGFQHINQLKFKSVSKRLLVRLFVFPVAPLIALLLTIAFNSEANWQAWASVSLICCLSVILMIVRWRRWGYYVDDKFVCIRKGLLGKDYVIFPKSKTQQVGFSQTPFMRKNKIASIRIVLASGTHRVPYIPSEDAMNILDDSLLIVERDKPAWM